MSPEEQKLLEQILSHYHKGDWREADLQAAVYMDKFRLLYHWVKEGEVSLTQFIHYLKIIKNSI
jgi:hypothetical protein